jgi:hypothetical protein
MDATGKIIGLEGEAKWRNRMNSVAAAHTLEPDQGHVRFRITEFDRLPGTGQPYMRVTYLGTGRVSAIGLTEDRLQKFRSAIDRSLQSGDVYWADLRSMPASPFDRVGVPPSDKMLNALQNNQVEPVSSTAP